jgi:hypothetical protein
MPVTEVRIHDTDDHNLMVCFTASPPFPDRRLMRTIFMLMEAESPSKWRYSAKTGRGSYQLREDYSLWADGGRMWIDMDANRVEFQAEADGERILSGVDLLELMRPPASAPHSAVKVIHSRQHTPTRVIELWLQAVDPPSCRVSFSVLPPVKCIEAILFVATGMERSELASCSYDAAAGTGDYELVGPEPTIWPAGACLRVKVDVDDVAADRPDMTEVAHVVGDDPEPAY